MPAISGPLMMSSGAAPSARLQVQIGDQAVLGAFDDVVGQALVERQVGGLLLDSPVAPRKCSAMAAMWNWLMAAFCSGVCSRQSSGAVRSDSSSARPAAC